MTKPRIRLQLIEAHKAASINVTIFQVSDTGKLGPHVATSGPFSDAICGVITPLVTLQPGNYRIISSTFSPGIEASFRLLVYSSGPVGVA